MKAGFKSKDVKVYLEETTGMVSGDVRKDGLSKSKLVCKMW